jgi:hypothetical protein
MVRIGARSAAAAGIAVAIKNAAQSANRRIVKLMALSLCWNAARILLQNAAKGAEWLTPPDSCYAARPI